jgi:hypothetical protein
MPTAELTVEMPVEELDFLRAYAKAQGTTVAMLMQRYAQALRNAPRRTPHPANVQLTGTIPSDVDAREVYRQHILKKHG